MRADPGLERDVAERLRAAGCVAAQDEAGRLIATASDRDDLEHRLARRELGQPLAWIVGSANFCGHTVFVDPGVYVPRWQSEELARRACAALPAGGRAVDLCTGTGAIARCLAMSAPGATVVGTDLDAAAVDCARRNGVTALIADLGAPFAGGRADVVTAVAPYVPTSELTLLPADVLRHEPRLALDGGGDGLDLVRRVIADAARLLRAGGRLFTEIGGDQLGPVAVVLDRDGFVDVESWSDDDGDLRGVSARRA